MKKDSMELPLGPQGKLQYEKLTGAAGQRTRTLWEQIFTEDTESFLTYYYGEKIPDAQIHVLSDESGQIVSMVHANPYIVMLHGVRRKSYYIVGVATAQPYRHRGCMAFLLQKAVWQAKSEGCPFVFLMPADAAIYEPFGFRYGARGALWERSAELKTLMEQCDEQCDAKAAGAFKSACVQAYKDVLGFACVPAYKDASGYRLTVYSDEDAGALAAYAAKMLARRYDTYCVHDEAYFERLSRELASENGALYLFWKKENSGICASEERVWRLCGYFCYACEENEFMQEVMVERRAEYLFIKKNEEDRIMFLPLEESRAYGRAYFPEMV